MFCSLLNSKQRSAWLLLALGQATRSWSVWTFRSCQIPGTNLLRTFWRPCVYNDLSMCLIPIFLHIILWTKMWHVFLYLFLAPTIRSSAWGFLSNLWPKAWEACSQCDVLKSSGTNFAIYELCTSFWCRLQNSFNDLLAWPWARLARRYLRHGVGHNESGVMFSLKLSVRSVTFCS